MPPSGWAESRLSATTTRIHPARIQPLNDVEPRPRADYVLYWMQQSQRAQHNDALEYAVQQANERRLPLLVGFGLMDDYPDANLRHYRFMLEGLKDVREALERRGMRFLIRCGMPPDVALEYGRGAALRIAIPISRNCSCGGSWRRTS